MFSSRSWRLKSRISRRFSADPNAERVLLSPKFRANFPNERAREGDNDGFHVRSNSIRRGLFTRSFRRLINEARRVASQLAVVNRLHFRGAPLLPPPEIYSFRTRAAREVCRAGMTHKSAFTQATLLFFSTVVLTRRTDIISTTDP